MLLSELKSHEFTRKDFLVFLLNGGSFNKLIQLNKTQLSKLSAALRKGNEPVVIDGHLGFVNGDGVWIPREITDANNRAQGIAPSTAAPGKTQFRTKYNAPSWR